MRRIIKELNGGIALNRHIALSSRRPKERGQVAILFALIFTFMFVLFAFVMDFGHLVNTKINLQLAADSAAYSGAAWQANTLNRLGMMNYHLRQDLKELAMRTQVTHLRHNRNFPRGSEFINGGPQTPNTEPFICQQAHGYVSLSGRRYEPNTNLCRNASPSTGGLPPIVVPPVIAAFDPFAVALAAQIRRIADAANEECKAAAEDNKILAEHLVSTYTRRSQFHATQMTQIADWLNEVGGGKLSENETHPIRKIAFESARRNLAFANRDGFEIEILPPAGNEYIRLEQNRINGSIFYVNYNVRGDGCVGRPGFIDFNDMILSMNKTTEILTFFSVKLTSKPQMLFMPQAWVDAAFPTLVAFSSAKPFGSRIGPDPQLDPLMPTANRPGNTNRMVNFSFTPGDRLGIMNTKVMALLDALHPFNGASRPDGNQASGWPDKGKGGTLREALQMIHAPTIFDAMFYPIFPNPNRQEEYLEPEYAEANYPDYLEASDPQGQIIQTREPSTARYFPVSGNRGEGWIKIDAKGSAGGLYGEYADEAPDSHSVTTAVGLPFVNETTAREFGFATREMVHSSWAPDGNPRRIGYSVKFIGLDALMGKLFVKQSNGGRGSIANKPTGDDNLTKIYH